MWQVTFFEREKTPPTQEKHAELGRVFRAWLDTNPPDGLVFDGFAGAGRFADASLGSPLLLLQEALRRDKPQRFVFCEKNPTNYARLCAAVSEHLGAPVAESYTSRAGTIDLQPTSFAQASERVLAMPGALFSFVDPYGYDGVTLASLRALAARGPLVFHLASQAIYTKVISATGDGPRQARRMQALLGDAVPWEELRREARALSPERAKALIAEVCARGFSNARIVALREGDSHLICTT